MNRQDFQRLALERLEDTQALLRAGRCSGAYYIAGYVIECALKACIARQTNQDDFPPKDAAKYYVHDIKDLRDKLGRKSPGLESQWEADERADAELAANWATVKDWTEEARYEPRGWTQQQAEVLLNAISDPEHGVLQWLRRYW
jgi:HEPN domain-containing protein